MVNKIIDSKYKVKKRIGGGGMGVVYLAEHQMMQRNVAIKIIHPNRIDEEDYEEFLMRFQREARTASKIEHPNVITIFDFGVFEARPYLVMQYNPGKTLTKILKEEGHLSVERTYKIIKQVCAALRASHQRGIIHRDLKPDNVMITDSSDGQEFVQVLDFGLAKAMNSDSGANKVTQSGVVLGTLEHVAPEHVQGLDQDTRSDIYGLGVLLYQMLSGSTPFKGDTPVELMFKHVNEAVPEFNEVTPEVKVPKSVQALVMKALEKDPEKRQQTVQQLVAEYASALKESKVKKKKAIEAKRKREDAAELLRKLEADRAAEPSLWRNLAAVCGLFIL